jgi:hypothetical protein
VVALLLACTTGATAADDYRSISSSTPRTPRVIALGPDVALTARLKPIATPAGQHAAFPGLVQHPVSRELTAAYRLGRDHVDSRDGDIVMATSTDEGLTYHNPTTVRSGKDYRDPSLALINGELWTTYFTGTASAPAQGAFVIRGDRPALRIDNLPYAAIAAPVAALPDGTVAAVYYGHEAGEQFDSVYYAWSTMGDGNTWSSTRIADGQKDSRHYQEPWLVVRDGRLHVQFRYGSWDSIGTMSSTDDGTTWSTPRKILDRATGRPTTLVFASGTMLMIYRQADTRAAVMATSRDGGATWRPAGVLLAPPGPLGMTYAAAVEVLPGVAHVVVAGEQADGSSTLSGGYVAEVAR